MLETPDHSPENRKSPEQMKADATKVILARARELITWQEISDATVDAVKQDFKQALDIPAAEQLRIRALGDRGGMRVEIESADNPLRRYVHAYLRLSSTQPQVTQIEVNPASDVQDASARIDRLILDTLKLPPELRRNAEFKRTKNGNVTEHQVIHTGSKNVLGIVEVDERTATITSALKVPEAIDQLLPKSLSECMAMLAKEGRLRDAAMRKTVEAAIRQELNLPEGFVPRALLLSGKSRGTYLDITVEDKETEQVVAEIEYNVQFGEFASHKVNKAVINRILKR
jgi:hypothetical protein